MEFHISQTTMMNRRDFAKVIAGAGAVAGGALTGCDRVLAGGRADAPPAARAVLMKVGCQSRGDTTRENLEYLARHGVHHMRPEAPRALPDGGWDLEDALRQQEQAARYGITIGAYHLPLTSAGIDRVKYPNIMLGKSPERDREIEIVQQKISVAGRAGVPVLMYNTIILPILRTGRTIDPTRGNASYSTWNMEEAYARGMDREIIPMAGEVDVDTVYERIVYFLDRVLPVAEEYNVKLGNHIADPPAPVGYRGVTRWNSPDIVAGIQRFARLYDSPSHGFNFCVGSTAEGLRDPATEIFPILEWVGNRGQLFNVHLRNIKGGWGYFEEVYPDNGDMNFVRVMRTLRDVGYDGMVMPDHVPDHPASEGTDYWETGDPITSAAGDRAREVSRDQAFSFAYGYIRALIQMLETEAT
jgi:mannonate dehydratase